MEKEQTPWFNLEDSERAKLVYSKFSIQNFWNWWTSGETKFMEIRIKNYELIKEVAAKFNIPWSPSGVFVNSALELKNVIAYVRDKATIWFGVMPRKRNWNKFGRKQFGGKDVNVEEIGFLFIDIDRVKKDGPATPYQLKQADELANRILERLALEKWNKGYIKICSGHGLQLLIKFDFPIRMPDLDYVNKDNTFIETDEYKRLKKLTREGIGKQVLTFARKYKDELEVEVDKSGFSLGRVAALPVSKNLKYDTFRWRGIIEMKDGNNIGLTDYVLSKQDDIQLYKKKNVFTRSSALLLKNRMRPGHLAEHSLIKFMLEEKLSYGEINNKLWFMIKCLIRDSKIDITSEEFRAIHRELERKVKGSLQMNVPDKKFQFDENIVNRYCINNCIPPLYKLWPRKTKKLDNKIEDLQWEQLEIIDGEIKLDLGNDILDDMRDCKILLVEGDYKNREKVIRFTRGCITKYGEKEAKYYFDYLFDRYFNYA